MPFPDSAKVLFVGIDPGPEKTAVSAVLDDVPLVGGIYENGQPVFDAVEDLIFMPGLDVANVGIEMIASYGMAVGKTVFETCVWIGRYCEMLQDVVPRNSGIKKVYRREVKLEICKSPRANDSNIRQAILDMYPPDGGGKTPQVGTKSKPGPLFGISKDMWASLGVAITAQRNWDKLEDF